MLELGNIIISEPVTCKRKGIISRIIRLTTEGLSRAVKTVCHDYIWEIWHLNETGILLDRQNKGMDVIYFVYWFAREDFLNVNII